MSTVDESSGIPWTRPRTRRYIFCNANIIDPLEATVLPNATVTISNGLIEKIELEPGSVANTEASSSPADSQVTRLDLQGRYLCPGLIDCHVHLRAVPGEKTLGQMRNLTDEVVSLRAPHVCRQMLERGFTTARDCGGTSIALKDAINHGIVDGPRLFISGHQLTQTGGHGDMRDSYDKTPCCGGHVFGGGILCDGVTECTRVARDELRRGADFIKIMAGGGVSTPTDPIDSIQFSPEEIRAITGVAKRQGTYVTCHAFTPESIRNAIDNGVMGVEHGVLIDAPTAKLMAEKGVFLTPTLATVQAMSVKPFSDFLPPPSQKKIVEILHAGLDSLRIADEAGVTMCFGTDLLGAMTQFETQEFSIRSQVLSATKILQSATTNAARMLRQDKFLGRIEEGFAADLLILNQNPLDDITVLDRPEKHLLSVMKEGRVRVSRWSKLAEEKARIELIE